jgi:hypothetical protein
MRIARKGTSLKQMAYARRVFGGQGKCKKQIALDVGYSPNVANSISSHIENKPGFNNAMAALAADSNNLALAAMHEFKARGFEEFSNKDLVGALNAIGSAWSRFNTVPKDPNQTPSTNRLRTVILQQIENQTVLEGNKVVDVTENKEEEEQEEVDDNLDF